GRAARDPGLRRRRLPARPRGSGAHRRSSRGDPGGGDLASKPSGGGREESMQALRGIAAALLVAASVQDPGARDVGGKPSSTVASGETQAVERAFLEHDVHLDLGRGTCWIPVRIDVREDLLEYLLVNPKGAAHESLFTTEVVPSRLNAALLALGVSPGVNAKWRSKEPPPTEQEMQDGAAPYVVDPPTGDGFCIYAGWREGGETHFHRVDDLLRNLETGRSMRRHAWVFLGSRVVRMRAREASAAKDGTPKEGGPKESGSR